MERKIAEPGLKPELRKKTFNILLFVAAFAGNLLILSSGRNQGIKHSYGYLILTASCFLALYFFLLQFRRDVLLVTRRMFFILLGLTGFVALTRIVSMQAGDDLLLLIPFAIIPIVIRTFYDARLAVILLVITIVLAGLMVDNPFEFVVMNFVAGLSAVFTLRTAAGRGRLFFTAFMVVVTLIVIRTGFILKDAGSLPPDFGYEMLLFACNGILVLVIYPVIFLFEQNFLLLSEATLTELTDTNHPLLRKLADEAPGSFQHSLQVANLAEEAARAIGANFLLVRAGSLYHDIGKLGNPRFFVENQTDENSPHENLDPRESAKIIISHVRNGVNLAKNYKIPVQIIDFIKMHHGTTMTYFFFKKFLDRNPGTLNIEEAEKDFKYHGPKPFSKETAIVMMADAVEASSRTLQNYSEENIGDLVERIVYLQEQDGQFSDVPLTYKDMSDIRDVLKRRLATIYHNRIVYPERH